MWPSGHGLLGLQNCGQNKPCLLISYPDFLPLQLKMNQDRTYLHWFVFSCTLKPVSSYDPEYLSKDEAKTSTIEMITAKKHFLKVS